MKYHVKYYILHNTKIIFNNIISYETMIYFILSYDIILCDTIIYFIIQDKYILNCIYYTIVSSQTIQYITVS